MAKEKPQEDKFWVFILDSLSRQMESLRQEVNRLKCEKLDLLKQNVVSTNALL